MAQNRDDSGLACEHPSGFWHSVLPERQWPSVVSAGCFGRQVYQDNARGSKRWSNCPVKTLSYLRRSWQALNKEYQRCCVKMQKFDVDTWVHQNVNVDAHLRSNPQQPTTPPPLSQTQVAEVQKILINAFKSNDRELFWKQFFQKLILSFARHFDSDEDMAETVLVDSCAGRGPPVVETVAGVPHVLRTYVGNPPGLYSPGAWVVSVGCWAQDPPEVHPPVESQQEPPKEPPEAPVESQKSSPQKVPEKPAVEPPEAPAEQPPPVASEEEPPPEEPPPVESEEEPQEPSEEQPAPIKSQKPSSQELAKGPPEAQAAQVARQSQVLAGSRSTLRFVGREDRGCFSEWLIYRCWMWRRT